MVLRACFCRVKSLKYPVCIDGERACPPEDCGGVDGYYRMLEILKDTSDPEHEEMKTWAGKDHLSFQPVEMPPHGI